MASNHPASEFVEKHTAKLQPLDKDVAEAYWQLNVTGDEAHAKRMAELDAERTRLHADPGQFALLREWRKESFDDPLLARQVELLYLAFLGNQKDEETIERISELEAGLELDYSNFRGEFEGRKASDNDLKDVLQNDLDSGRRRAAWEATRQVGPVVAHKVIELIGLRNKVAAAQGFSSYYRMSLETQELSEEELFAVLNDLERRTREPFIAAKAKLDSYLKRRFGVSELWPWHYGDAFFQEAPPSENVDLNPFFRGKDVVGLSTETFDRIGLDVRPVLERSDLFPREGKHQHAFCVSIDRENDVRVLCNIQQDENWTSTTLHELGHGVYDYYLDRSLPFLLREPAHMLTTEAIAMLMGRLTKSPFWLRTVAGVGGAELERVLPHLREHESLAMLIFVRWCLVMTHFERDMYANPQADLNTPWWDYVERFQMLRRPEGRNAPDWAAKLHLALAPVYYHNYMLGEMVASQLQNHIIAEVHPDGAAGGEQVGAYLKDKVFAPGASLRWDDMLEQATGERLNARHFAGQFVG